MHRRDPPPSAHPRALQLTRRQVARSDALVSADFRTLNHAAVGATHYRARRRATSGRSRADLGRSRRLHSRRAPISAIYLGDPPCCRADSGIWAFGDWAPLPPPAPGAPTSTSVTDFASLASVPTVVQCAHLGECLGACASLGLGGFSRRIRQVLRRRLGELRGGRVPRLGS